MCSGVVIRSDATEESKIETNNLFKVEENTGIRIIATKGRSELI